MPAPEDQPTVVRIYPPLRQRVEAAAGEVPLARWVARKLEDALDRETADAPETKP